MTAKIIALSLLGAVLFLFILPTLVATHFLYRIILVRTRPDKWRRECPMPEDAEYKRMFDLGMEWHNAHHAQKSEVSVTSDGLRLMGEYFDFGFDRAVIIIAGRTESLLYSYYFAEPYRAAGWNVLVIDNRAHGLSEGKKCCLGYSEYRDLLQWSRLLHEEKGIKKVLFHGICIGASTALFALTAPDAPEYLAGLVAEGMYATFGESFKNHMLLDHRPIFPFFWGAMANIRIFSGANVVTDGPIKRISGLRKPILLLHSREDVFSVPARAQELYDLCQSDKELVWFSSGSHSRIRINDTEHYDAAITRFVNKL